MTSKLSEPDTFFLQTDKEISEKLNCKSFLVIQAALEPGVKFDGRKLVFDKDKVEEDSAKDLKF